MGSPEPLFILTCMRSYSSLVSSMLGQHPGLYVLPEINPFVASDLGTAMDLFSMVRPHSLDGLLRLTAELEFGAQTEQTVERAREWLTARQSWTSSDLFDHISTRIAPRIAIEKSPSTTVTRGGLDRALAQFPDAHYLHLYRHPIATCNSIAKITKFGEAAGWRRSFIKDPEVSWFDANSGVERAIDRFAPGKFMSIRGEDILSNPDLYLGQICNWLGLNASTDDLQAMRHPENSPFARLGPANAPFGNDRNFLENPVYSQRPIVTPPLESDLAWAQQPRRLRSETLQLSYVLGYGGTAPAEAGK